jgi:hypothetical protein
MFYKSKREDNKFFAFFTAKNFIKVVAVLTIGFSINEYINAQINSMVYELEIAKKELAATKKELNKNNQEIFKLVDVIHSEREKHARFESILKDLDRCKYPIISFGIAVSESNAKYKINHPTTDLVGIGGVKPKYWKQYLEKKKVKVNSIVAIDTIYQSLLYKNGHVNALKKYKGTITKNYSFRKTEAYIKKIKNSNNFRLVMNLHKKNNKRLKDLGLA